jgi:hypothetical protein
MLARFGFIHDDLRVRGFNRLPIGKSLPTMLVRVTIAAPQPIAAGAAARHIIQPKKRTKPFTVARNPQSFQRPFAAGQPRNRRQKTSRKVVSRRTAGGS